MIVGKWTDADSSLQFLAGFNVDATSSHKNVELDFRWITGIIVFAFGALLLACSFVQDQVPAFSC